MIRAVCRRVLESVPVLASIQLLLKSQVRRTQSVSERTLSARLGSHTTDLLYAIGRPFYYARFRMIALQNDRSTIGLSWARSLPCATDIL